MARMVFLLLMAPVPSLPQLAACGWECADLCLPHKFICDGFSQCWDDSDEVAGCDLFPGSGCPSPAARRQHRCKRTGQCFPSRAEAARCEDQDTTTLPGCENCVPGRGEGTSDTPGSGGTGQDGLVLLAVLAAVTLVLIGLLLSYFCRFLNTKNVNNFFHCDICSSSNRRKVSAYEPGQGQGHEARIITDCDIPAELIFLLENKASNWAVARRGGLLGRGYTVSCLQPEAAVAARREFLTNVHCHKRRYLHLYTYWAARCGTAAQLGKVCSNASYCVSQDTLRLYILILNLLSSQVLQFIGYPAPAGLGG